MNKAVCDRCGFTYPVSKLKKTWDGLWVCPKDFEVRHPQDFAGRATPETPPTISRPPSDIFLTSNAGVPLGSDLTTLLTMTVVETVTSTDMVVTTAPTTPTAGAFLSPGDVTSDDL